jgi:hypothetical protein
MTIEDHLDGKSPQTRQLFFHFLAEFEKAGKITVHPAKTMIGIATPRKRIAYITQLGKNYIHVVFMFQAPHHNNLCFQKIAQVPGEDKQFNHHFRMLSKDDVNAEVRKFMELACAEGT